MTKESPLVLRRFVFEFGYMTTRNSFRPSSPVLNTMLFRYALLPFLGFSLFVSSCLCSSLVAQVFHRQDTRLLFLFFSFKKRFRSSPWSRYCTSYSDHHTTTTLDFSLWGPSRGFYCFLSTYFFTQGVSIGIHWMVLHILLLFPLSLAFDSWIDVSRRGVCVNAKVELTKFYRILGRFTGTRGLRPTHLP